MLVLCDSSTYLVPCEMHFLSPLCSLLYPLGRKPEAPGIAVCLCMCIVALHTVCLICVCTSVYAFTGGMFFAPGRETDPTCTTPTIPSAWPCPGILACG